MKHLAVVLVALLVAAAASARAENIHLNIESVTVTGLSAGAFFASQYHVAFSSQLVGAGVIAGGPFYCAQGSMVTADVTCRIEPEMVNTQTLVDAAQSCAKGGVCDDLSNLASQKVYLYSGTHDSVVYQGIVKKAEDFYTNFMSSSNITTEYDIASEHCWATTDYGNSCAHLGEPYINNCNYDASFEMMNAILGNINQPTTANSSALYSVDQSTYTPSGLPAGISMGPKAYVYVPGACFSSTCRLAIVLHGCTQTVDDIGLDFVNHIGMNEVGEANNIVMVYPQAIKSYISPENPEGCFDWWGYTNSDYANQKGPQMATINALVNAIKAGTADLQPVSA